MRGFLVLGITLLAVAAPMLGSTATAQASTHDSTQMQLQITAVESATVEIPGVVPVVAQVVHDPGSCSDAARSLDVKSENEPLACCGLLRKLGRGCRLLWRSARGC